MFRLKSQVKGSFFHDLYHSLKVQYTYKLSNNRVSIFTLKFISTVGACDVIENDVIENDVIEDDVIEDDVTKK